MEIEDYERRIEAEKKYFEKEKYNEDLTEKSNDALAYMLTKFHDRMRNRIGANYFEYIINLVNKKMKNNSKQIKISSLGCGPGGGEIRLARDFVGDYVMDSFDINEDSLKMGQKKADELGLNLHFKPMDLNKLKLDENYYDVIIAHASLHHLINHEHVCSEVKKAMKSDSEFIVFDGIARNGLRLWPETKVIANQLFRNLPERYRYHHTTHEHLKSKPWTELPDVDITENGFECIRSQDLYQILKKEFKTKFEVPGFCFARRFVDNEFGPNYDMKNPFDKAIIDTIIKSDEEYALSHNLRPEVVFLALTK